MKHKLSRSRGSKLKHQGGLKVARCLLVCSL